MKQPEHISWRRYQRVPVGVGATLHSDLGLPCPDNCRHLHRQCKITSKLLYTVSSIKLCLLLSRESKALDICKTEFLHIFLLIVIRCRREVRRAVSADESNTTLQREASLLRRLLRRRRTHRALVRYFFLILYKNVA